MNLTDLEICAKRFAAERQLLNERVQALHDELEQVKRRHLAGVKGAIARCAQAGALLHSGVEQHPELFEKPKTQVFHGIKIGYRKGVGGLDWEDDADVVAKIEKYFKEPEEAEAYLIVKKKPSADALEGLDAATLKKFGITVVETGEQVVVKPVDGDVDKLVKALLKDALEQATEAA